MTSTFNRNTAVALLVFSVAMALLIAPFGVDSASAQTPTITNLSPGIDATDVSVDATIEVSFSEIPSFTNFTPATDASFTCNEMPVAFTPSVSQNFLTGILTPTSPLPEGATCNISLAVSNITNSQGTPFADDLDGNDNGVLEYSFTVEAIAPEIEAVTPMDGATGVPVDTDIMIDLTEIVVKSAAPGSYTFECGDGNIDLAVTGLDRANAIFTLSPTTELPLGATCTVSVVISGWEDADGNTLIDNQEPTNDDTYAWSFDTELAPQVLSVNPASGATDVALDQDIVFQLSEAELRLTQNFSITSTCSSVRVAVDGQADTATMSPVEADLTTPSTWTAGTECTISFPVAEISDADGNVFIDTDGTPDGTYTYIFTTTSEGDMTPPELSSTSPADMETSVDPAANIVHTFSEPIQGTGDFFSLSCGGNEITGFSIVEQSFPSTTVTVDPDSDLPQDTSCTVTINTANIEDAAGNALGTGDATFSFIVGPGPELAENGISFTAGAQQGTVAVETNIQHTFTEPVEATGPFFTLNCGDGDITAFSVVEESFPSTTVTIDPDSNLPFDATCNITINAENVVDAAGNKISDQINAPTIGAQFTTEAEEVADPAPEGAPMIEGAS